MVDIVTKPLRDANGKPVCRVIELPIEGRTTMDAMALINSEGKQVGLAGIGPDGHGYIALIDQHGIRATVTFSESGEPVLATFDETNNCTGVFSTNNWPVNTREENHGKS